LKDVLKHLWFRLLHFSILKINSQYKGWALRSIGAQVVSTNIRKESKQKFSDRRVEVFAFGDTGEFSSKYKKKLVSRDTDA
jgi:hypothetical protein